MPSPQIHRGLAPESEFRLVILLPSPEFDSQLECRLEHAIVGQCKPYEALSYVWGSSELTKQIILDNHQFMITPNLEIALRYIRLPEEERTMWIDSICINQRDLAERREQVGYMRQIYSNCSSDVVWLRPKDKRYLRGMDIIRKLQGFNLKQIDSLGWRRKELQHIDTRSRPDKSSGLTFKQWLLSSSDSHAVEKLLRHNPVWKRVWIMQEISCAPRVILTCGNETLDWSLVETILDGEDSYSDAFHTPFGHGSSPVWTSLFGMAKFVTTQRAAMSKIKEGGESTLLDVLARFKDTASTDPRDKVYGLLGLVSDTLGVEADYTKSVQETYIGVAVALINSSANLDLLCQSPWRLPGIDRDRRLEGLPDWVPDFRSSARGKFLFAQRDLYSPGRPTCSVPCLVQGSSIIHLNGFLLGRLKAPNENDVVRRSHENKIRHWAMKDLTMHASGHNAQSEYHTGENRVQAFARTLVGDCKGFPTERLTPEDISHDRNIIQEVIAQEATTERVREMRSFRKLDHLLSENWQFHVSDNDFFVLAQSGTSEGDLLVILDGAKTPMLLRPTTEDPEGNVLYQPIGGAYVHGFMDGEVFQRQDEFKEQVFWVT